MLPQLKRPGVARTSGPLPSWRAVGRWETPEFSRRRFSYAISVDGSARHPHLLRHAMQAATLGA